MKSAVNIIRFFIIFLLIGALFVIIKSNPLIDKDMISLVDSSDLPLKEISSKNSYTLNIIFKSSNFDSVVEISKDFYSRVKLDNFSDIKYKIDPSTQESIIDILSSHKQSLISDRDYKYLLSHDYDYFLSQSINKLTTSFSPSIIPFDQDPFFIFSNYLKSIIPTQGYWSLNHDYISSTYEGSSYLLMSLVLKKDRLNYIEDIFNIKKQLDPNSTKIFISGVAAHTFISTKNTSKQINILMIISSLLVIILSINLLRSFRLLILITINIFLSFVLAYSGLVLFFKNETLINII